MKIINWWRSCQICLNLALILIACGSKTGFSFWYLIPIEIGENFNGHTQRFLLQSLRVWYESFHLTGIRQTVSRYSYQVEKTWKIIQKFFRNFSLTGHEPDRVTEKLIHLFRNFNLWVMSQTVIGKRIHQNFMSSG